MLEGAIQLASGVTTSYRTVESPDVPGACHVEVVHPVNGRWIWSPLCGANGWTPEEALQRAEEYCDASILSRHEKGKAPMFEAVA